MATETELDGVKIKQLRLEKNLTQVELANIVGISEQSVNRIERGKHSPRASTYMRLIAALSEKSDKAVIPNVNKSFGEQVEVSLVISKLQDENSRIVEENAQLRKMLGEAQAQITSLLTMLGKPKGNLQTRTDRPLHRSKMRQVPGQVTLTPARRGAR